MKLMNIANNIAARLTEYNPVIVNSTTSVYIRLENSKIKQIRVSDHNGRKTSRNCLEVRTDATTSRKNQIYGVLDIKHAVSLVIKFKNKM
jgi:hypothetical protein